MKVLAVVGSADAGRERLVEALVERLSERGRVGTVTDLGDEPNSDEPNADVGSPGAARTEAIGSDGWVATGDRRTLEGALDNLAVDCNYAIVAGFDDASLPTIALDDATVDATVDEPLISAPTADDVSVDDAVAAIESVEDYETLESLVARVKRSPDGDQAGAIATFTGRVRERDGPDDDPTEHLEFEKYDGVAEARMATIREEIESRDGVFDVLLHHKTGVVDVGEDIVFVVVLAGHRTEAFAAVQDGINRLKEEVPLFKKEVTVSGEFWAHEH